MPYIKCQSCGNGSVQTLDIDICTKCIKLGNDKVKILAIKKYLEKYPEAKAQEVSQNLGISGKIIDRFIKEGSLILVQNGEKIRVKLFTNYNADSFTSNSFLLKEVSGCQNLRELKSMKNTAKILLEVENTGVHINEQNLPHLFDAFYRVDSSRNRKNGGSGLGLYIVREILEQHGAEYEVRNTEAGVCFQMELLPEIVSLQ